MSRKLDRVPAVVMMLCLVLAAVVASTLLAAKRKPTPRALQMVCISNMRQLAMAIQVYAMDNGDRLPPLRWVDAIWETPQKHAAEPVPKDFIALISDCPVDKSKWSYAMNLNLCYRKVTFYDRKRTVLLFESSSGQKNRADPGASWPKQLRHPDGNCIAYADGHCAFVKTKPDFRLIAAPPTASQPRISR